MFGQTIIAELGQNLFREIFCVFFLHINLIFTTGTFWGIKTLFFLQSNVLQPGPVVVLIRINLVIEGHVGPENDHILIISVIVNSMGTLARNGDTLPLLGPVLDAIEGDDGMALQDVVEHGSGVAMVRLGLARGQGHQPSPGVAQVTAVAPGQLVLVILHLEAQVVPADPFFARIPIIGLNNFPVELTATFINICSLVPLLVASVIVGKLWILPGLFFLFL